MHHGEDDDEEAIAAELFDESCSIPLDVAHAMSSDIAPTVEVPP